MKLQIKLDEKRLKEIQLMLRDIPKAMPKIMTRAINKTATSVRAEVVREIGKKIALKLKDIREDITIYKANWSRWEASVNIRRKRHGLIRFGARQTKKGVSYRIEKSGGRKSIQHAFIAESNSAENVWIREEGAGGKLVPRLPIQRLQGPSIGEVFKRAIWLVQQTYAKAQTTLDKNINTQIDLMLDKLQRARAA